MRFPSWLNNRHVVVYWNGGAIHKFFETDDDRPQNPMPRCSDWQHSRELLKHRKLSTLQCQHTASHELKAVLLMQQSSIIPKKHWLGICKALAETSLNHSPTLTSFSHMLNAQCAVLPHLVWAQLIVGTCCGNNLGLFFDGEVAPLEVWVNIVLHIPATLKKITTEVETSNHTRVP